MTISILSNPGAAASVPLSSVGSPLGVSDLDAGGNVPASRLGNTFGTRLLWGPDPSLQPVPIAARFDAAAIVGLADGAAVATWNDSGPNGYNAVQATAGKRPTYYSTTAGKTVNGLPAVWFSGPSNQYVATPAFTVALTQPTTIFAVGRFTSLSDNAVSMLFDGIVSTNRNFLYGNTGGQEFFGAATASPIAAGADLNLHLFSLAYNDTASTYQIDAATPGTGSPSTQGLTGLTLGAAYNGGFGMTGLICEVIVFSGLLTVAQTAAVQAYLTAKWFTSTASAPWTKTGDVRGMYGTPYAPLSVYGARPVAGFDNQPAVVAAVTALINQGLTRAPQTAGYSTDAGCGTTSGSSTVTDTHVGALDTNAYVSGPGIPALTVIDTVTAGVSFTMKHAVTGAAVTATATATVTLGVGWPLGKIQVDVGHFDINSPCPNFGPYVTLQGINKESTWFNFKGSGVCCSWVGAGLVSANIAGMLVDGITITGGTAAASGRVDTGVTTSRGSTTVLDANCVSGDLNALVYGPGISVGVTITAVTPGVSFTLSYKAAFDLTSASIQIGGVRNVGMLLNGVCEGTVGPDTAVSLFGRPGSVGLMVQGSGSGASLTWNEKVNIPHLVLYGNTIQCLCYFSSVEYNQWGLVTYATGSTTDTMVVDSCWWNYGSLSIRGNLYVNTGQVSRVLSVYGETVVSGIQLTGIMQGVKLEIDVEYSGSGAFTQTINLGPASVGFQGSTGNAIMGCYGRLKFGYGSESFVPLNVTPLPTKFEFIGTCFGDSVICPPGGYIYPVEVGCSTKRLAQTAINFAGGDYFDLPVLAANLTVAFTNNVAGPARKTIRITQAASGGPWTVTWPSNATPTLASPLVVWTGGAPVQSTAASVADLYALTTMDGLKWYGSRIAG